MGRYREKINPVNRSLPDKDVDYIKEKIMARVKSELITRISKGYDNIDLELIESLFLAANCLQSGLFSRK